ncbi:ATP-binding protein [Kitasatospora sp. NPDC059571]|uniref:ATP-binding protein n=1 Tax=Kitasatospora sp. NPDC059571 TaxID=3346871 RepID=UPI00367C0773
MPEKVGPTSSSMAVPHGPASVGAARRRLRRELGDHGIADTVVDDAVLILSELLSNSCRYARPLGKLTELDETSFDEPGEPDPGGILVRWWTSDDGPLTLSVTDGGSVTRPMPASPSLTARGGRGLSIVGRLSCAWGVRDAPGEVTVWAALQLRTGKSGDLAGDPTA